MSPTGASRVPAETCTPDLIGDSSGLWKKMRRCAMERSRTCFWGGEEQIRHKRVLKMELARNLASPT